MAFIPSENPITHPTRESYTELRPFRFWCQKVLPLVYDDSLSYYELLCKVVDYLNKTMEDVDHMNTDVDTLYTSFQQFQEGTFKIYNELVAYVNTYFDELDVQEEIDNKLDAMASSGELTTILSPTIANEVSKWMSEHLTPTSPIVDDTLTISGAAADSKTVGDELSELKETLGDVYGAIDRINYLTGEPVAGSYISYESGNVGANPDWSYYPPFPIEGGFYYIAAYASAHVAFFDENKNYISGVLVNNSPSNFDFIAPANAAYASYSYLTASGEQYFMRSTEQAPEYIDSIYKKLDKNVSLDLVHFLPILKLGKNLFNKFNLINGYCMDYVDGNRIWRNANYCFCPDYIPVKPSTAYAFNRLCIVAEYDADLNCVVTNNKTAVGSGVITTSATTKYIRIGTQIAKANELQIEAGNVRTSYTPFEYTLKTSRVFTVKSDGSGDYTTISDAVANASEDSIIIVYPGIYEESVHAYDKRVHIVGLDRAKCVLTYSALDYANPPLEMARGSVRNLTIKATNTGTEGAHHAYCVHIDNDNEANEALSFINVDFINEVHQAVGIGLRAHFTLTFDTCRFKVEDQAALYCHDWETSDSSADKTGQRLIVRNCSIVNNSASRAAILLQSQELVDKGAEAVFIGNSVYNGSGPLVSMVLWAGRTLTNTNFMGSSDWVLSTDSALNSTDLINASALNIAYTTPSALLNRVSNIVGGYCKIGRIVYVNVSFTSAVNQSNTPSLLGGLPKPLNNNAVLSAVKATNGIGSTIEDSVLCGVNNTSLYMAAVSTNAVYYVTGTYISES